MISWLRRIVLSEGFLVVSIFTGFLLFRLWNLLLIPVYLDEGIYFNWAYLSQINEGLRYVPLQDGKTPLFLWILGWLYNFIKDPLLAGRLLSVISSLVTCFCFWLFARDVLGKKAAIIYIFIYLFLPFGLLIERFAFVDSMLLAFCSAGFILSYFGVKRIIKSGFGEISLSFFVLSGLFWGLAYYTKTTTFALIIINILGLISWGLLKNHKFKYLFKLVTSFLVQYFVFYEMVGILRGAASRFWTQVAAKEQILTFSIGEILKFSFMSVLAKNLTSTLSYFWYYLTPGMIVLFLVGLYQLFRKSRYELLLVCSQLLLILFAVLLSAKFIASRYIYLTIPWIVFITTAGLMFFLTKFRGKQKIVIVSILLIPVFYADFLLTTKPKEAWFPWDDREYFVAGDLSGYGISETILEIGNALYKNPVSLGLDINWGPPEAIRTYYNLNSRPYPLSVFYTTNIGDKIKSVKGNEKGYFLILTRESKPEEIAKLSSLQLVKKIEKGRGIDGIIQSAYLFKIKE